MVKYFQILLLIIGFSAKSLADDTLIAPPFENFAIGLKLGIYIPILQTNLHFRRNNIINVDDGKPYFTNSNGYKLGLNGIFGLNKKLSFAFGVNYSFFNYSISNIYYYDSIIDNKNTIQKILKRDRVDVIEQFLEIPLIFRQRILNNVIPLEKRNDQNNIGVSLGTVYSYRLANSIIYNNEEIYKYTNQIILNNKIKKYKFDINLGLDLVQPNYLISLNWNYSLFKNLTEDNNPMKYGKERFYAQFNSVNLDFTYFLFNIHNGKIHHIFDNW